MSREPLAETLRFILRRVELAVERWRAEVRAGADAPAPHDTAQKGIARAYDAVKELRDALEELPDLARQAIGDVAALPELSERHAARRVIRGASLEGHPAPPSTYFHPAPFSLEMGFRQQLEELRQRLHVAVFDVAMLRPGRGRPKARSELWLVEGLGTIWRELVRAPMHRDAYTGKGPWFDFVAAVRAAAGLQGDGSDLARKIARQRAESRRSDDS
jgi:hypothetical protein